MGPLCQAGAVLDALADGAGAFLFLVCLADGTCRWSSNTAGQLAVSWEGAPLAGMWEALLPQEEQEAFLAEFQALAAGERPSMAGRSRLRRADGGYDAYRYRIDRLAQEGPGYLTGRIESSAAPRTSDPVTGLPDLNDLQKEVSSRIQEGAPCALLLIGIDNFKPFNDLYSFDFGNQVLRYSVGLFSGLLPRDVGLYRAEGDGVCALFGHADKDAVSGWFDRLLEAARRPYTIDGVNVSFTLSAGLSVYPGDSRDGAGLYTNAALALHAAKSRGKNQLVAYTSGLAEHHRRRAHLLNSMREAVALGFRGFTLCYQPLVHASDASLAGCEALLRWEHPDFLQIETQEFISALEESGQIVEVGWWVLETAVRQCSKWLRHDPDLFININVTSRQFEEPNFKFKIIDLLSRYRVPTRSIILELTESGEIEDPKKVGEVFDFLRRQGLHIALDDFGTGYASLDIFRKLNADELKIDRSFLERISYDVTDQVLIAGLIKLCHSMGMTVCVEGVETEKLDTLIREMEPDYLQGYYYGRPMGARAFSARFFSARREARAPVVPAGPIPQHQVHQIRPEVIFDHAYASIVQVDLDEGFTFLACNEGCRRMLGYSMAEMEEKFQNRSLGFVYPEDTAYVAREVRRQLGEGDTVTIEFRVVRKDGTPIWILGTGSVYHEPGGGTSLIVVTIDNDKAKQKALSMQREGSIYQMLMRELPAAIALVRCDEGLTAEYLSHGILKLAGYVEAEAHTLLEDRFIDLILPGDREEFLKGLANKPNGRIFPLGFHLLCKSGEVVWVEATARLFSIDGIQRLCFNLYDASDVPVDQVVNREMVDRYESAANQWGEFLFQYDLQTDTLTSSENFNKLFRSPAQRPFPYALALVYEEDRPLLLDAVEQCKRGEKPSSIELRLNVPGGEARWFSLTFSFPQIKGETAVSVMGKLTDIDAAKREHEQLLKQARQDSLTGLLNKGTIEEEIRERLFDAPDDARFALLMMDVDYFKTINDRYGHFIGDETLRKVAQLICALFRREDLVGRAGGDEFIAFLPLGEDHGLLQERAESIQRTIRTVELPGGGHLTASIGIARYPENGKSFDELFQQADRALYCAKELGRDCFCVASEFVGNAGSARTE